MSYIEREAARDMMEQALVDEWEIQYADDRLDEIPAADVVEVDSVIPFVRVCDRKEYIKNSEKLINEYLAELLERFGVRCLAQIDNINGTVKFWTEKMDGGVNDAAD